MRGRVVALVVALALVATGCDWYQWGGTGAHRGTGLEPDITKTTVPSFVDSHMADLPTSSPAATANGLVFVEQDGKLLAFDSKTYAAVWSAELPAGSTAGGAPAVYINGTASTVFVTVATASNTVLAGYDVNGIRNCDPAMFTCSPVFFANVGSTPGPATPPVVDGGRIFAAAAGVLAAYDPGAQTNCATTLGIPVCTPLWAATTGVSTAGVGPTAENGTVYAPVTSGAGSGLRAFDEGTGTVRWTGTLPGPASATPSIGLDSRVFAPAGDTIAAFVGAGCEAATCAADFSLAQSTGDPAGAFRSTPAFDGGRIFATDANGRLEAWTAGGCGAATCRPVLDQAVNLPSGGSTTYRQSPVLNNGMVFLLAQRVVGGTNHIEVFSLDQTSGNGVASWDLGAGGFGAGLANLSMSLGVLYAPIDGSIHAIHAPAVRPLASLTASPLTLTPAFSPSVFDYVVRCASGTNSLTFTMSAVAGGTVGLVQPTTTTPSASQTATVSLNENQAAVVRATNAAGQSADYWVRCLPADFPALTLTPHPAAGTPTPGWYVLGNNLLTTGATSYAMILDTNGTPVWYKKVSPAATNVIPLSHDVVAYYPDQLLVGFGTDPNGGFTVNALDPGTVQTQRAVGTPTDAHEMYQRPNGDRMMLSYPLKRGVDLTGMAASPDAGPNSTIADCVIQELSPQGQVVWQWTASDHIDPVTESTTAPIATIAGEQVYDVFHCNSIDVNQAGDVLLSARHANAVYQIRRSDGKIDWKLGGTPVNKDGAVIIQTLNDPEGSNRQQHDARYMPDGHISMYDNQIPLTANPARAVEYAVDVGTKTAQPVFSYVSPENLPACCMGSFRTYPDGHRVIGWGYIGTVGRTLTELNPAGQSVLDIAIPVGQAAYRAIKVPPPFFNVDVLRNTAGR